MKTLSRVLCVEDEPDIQAVAKMALEMVGGFTVKVCSSGPEALAEVAAFNPDLVLLDVMMPGMDGPSTLAALRARPGGASLPVIFLTAKIQPHDVDQFRKLGALDVIGKPFDPMTLADRVRDIWKRAGD